MQGPDRPLTAEGVLAWARSQDDDPGSVVPHPHPFDQDPVTGGFACVGAGVFHVAGHDGAFGSGVLDDEHPVGGIDAYLDQWWARARHAARDLDPATLGRWQRAAVAAVERGTTVADLPPAERVGIDTDRDRDHADWVWLRLRRSPHPPLRALAGDDSLLAPPGASGRQSRRTHPCPLCARPAPHQDRYPRAVCDDCVARTVDASGRRVVGFNVSMSGGFEARYADDTDQVCVEVTATGRVWVDGRACSMGEARFGGTVVESL